MLYGKKKKNWLCHFIIIIIFINSVEIDSHQLVQLVLRYNCIGHCVVKKHFSPFPISHPSITFNWDYKLQAPCFNLSPKYRLPRNMESHYGMGWYVHSQISFIYSKILSAILNIWYYIINWLAHTNRKLWKAIENLKTIMSNFGLCVDSQIALRSRVLGLL